MPSASPKNNSGITPFLVSFFLVQAFFFFNSHPYLFSAEDISAKDASSNAGLIVNNDVPEAKKGTVLLKEPSVAGTSGSITRKAPKEEELGEREKEARAYHIEGMNYQDKGDFEIALDYYQKAVLLDPFYAIAYNDLGVMYEALDQPERAEDAYLKALNIDPQLLGAYSNLAMLNESRRDLRQAAYYWGKRAELGLAGDAWTEKARQRYQDIEAVLSDRPLQQDRREQETIELLHQVINEKAVLKKDDAAQGRVFFEKAKALYSKGDDVAAYKAAIDAHQLDPANKEIEQFIDKVQHRVLSR